MRSALLVLMSWVLLLGVTGCTSGEVAPTEIELKVTETGPSEPERVEVPLGSKVTMVVTSTISDRLHVHGYELEPELSETEAISVSFKADMAGVYEVETHSNGVIWMKLVIK